MSRLNQFDAAELAVADIAVLKAGCAGGGAVV